MNVFSVFHPTYFSPMRYTFFYHTSMICPAFYLLPNSPPSSPFLFLLLHIIHLCFLPFLLLTPMNHFLFLMPIRKAVTGASQMPVATAYTALAEDPRSCTADRYCLVTSSSGYCWAWQGCFLETWLRQWGSEERIGLYSKSEAKWDCANSDRVKPRRVNTGETSVVYYV